METAHSPPIGESPTPARQIIEQLSGLFGSYKAEWLRERVYEFFTEPSYFPELTTTRPCVLQGGRGTGKTTVLRCLSYEGRYALEGRDSSRLQAWDYYGYYYRINTNRVTAFRGPELPEHTWVRYFAHYLNLELCGLALDFLMWFAAHAPTPNELSPTQCAGVAAALNLAPCSSVSELAAAVVDSRRRFEAAVNNAGDPESRFGGLSMQGVPLDTLLSAMQSLPDFKGKKFFFLIDEYENLLDYQQQILNTLIKHCGELYTFKIGVKELGLRVRFTLNPHERLVSPADYVLLPISEKLGDRFPEFAAHVCNDRIARMATAGKAVDVHALLPGLTEDQEALELGVADRVAEARAKLAEEGTPELSRIFGDLPPLLAYFISFWAEGHETTLRDSVRSYINDPDGWHVRYGNYKHAILFTLRKGKRGVRKYYCGWESFIRLAAGNIRYVLELVEQACIAHVREGGNFGDAMPPKTQTFAAQAVGRKNVKELDGLSVHGAKLTKLLLGLGRVFQVMALHPEGHMPEANQFGLKEAVVDVETEQQEFVDEVIRDAVMHLVLIRFPGNKLQDPGDTRAYDYMVHPIFCAFFEFSYRRKRKIGLLAQDIDGLINSPRRTISEILARQNRSDAAEALPEQLRLFGDYYARS